MAVHAAAVRLLHRVKVLCAAGVDAAHAADQPRYASGHYNARTVAETAVPVWIASARDRAGCWLLSEVRLKKKRVGCEGRCPDYSMIIQTYLTYTFPPFYMQK